MHVTFRHLRPSRAAVGRAAVPLNHLFFSCHLSEISEPGRGQRTVTLTEVVELQMKVREYFTITEKAPSRLEVEVKLRHRQKDHNHRASLRIYANQSCVSLISYVYVGVPISHLLTIG